MDDHGERKQLIRKKTQATLRSALIINKITSRRERKNGNKDEIKEKEKENEGNIEDEDEDGNDEDVDEGVIGDNVISGDHRDDKKKLISRTLTRRFIKKEEDEEEDGICLDGSLDSGLDKVVCERKRREKKKRKLKEVRNDIWKMDEELVVLKDEWKKWLDESKADKEDLEDDLEDVNDDLIATKKEYDECVEMYSLVHNEVHLLREQVESMRGTTKEAISEEIERMKKDNLSNMAAVFSQLELLEENNEMKTTEQNKAEFELRQIKGKLLTALKETAALREEGNSLQSAIEKLELTNEVLSKESELAIADRSSQAHIEEVLEEQSVAMKNIDVKMKEMRPIETPEKVGDTLSNFLENHPFRKQLKPIHATSVTCMLHVAGGDQGEMIWCGCEDGSISRWKLDGNRILPDLSTFSSSPSFLGEETSPAMPLTRLIIFPSSGMSGDPHVVGCGKGDHLCVWKTSSTICRIIRSGYACCVATVGSSLWIGTADGDIKVYETKRWNYRQTLRSNPIGPQPHLLKGAPQIGGKSVIKCLLLCGRRVWAGGSDGNITVWNTTTLKPQKPLSGASHLKAVSRLISVGPDQLWSSGMDRSILVWHSITCQPLRRFQLEERIYSIASIDGGKMVWASTWNPQKIYSFSTLNIEDGSLNPSHEKHSTIVSPHSAAVTDLLVDSRGRVWTSSIDKTLFLWKKRNELAAFFTLKERRSHARKKMSLKKIHGSQSQPEVKTITLTHLFEAYRFNKFSFCMYCTNFIWGLTGKQGIRCKLCHYEAHRKCKGNAMALVCPGKPPVTS